jgi:hypothetical protein
VLHGARKALVVGIGGGGDVVGALSAAGLAAAGGTPSILGGLTWERRPIDPLPGPRRLDEVRGAEVLNGCVALAGPGTTGPGGFRFAEARMAELLGEPTLLLDPHGGPAAVADGLAHAAQQLGADVVVLLDVGGDVLAHGDEAGLSSPLADAVVLAAAPRLIASGVEVIGAVFGAGCDGELTPEEVVERLGEIAAAGGALGDHQLDDATMDRLEAAVAKVPTEASLMALRCARGERGEQPIREGRRFVRLTDAGGRLALFDPVVALQSAARLAAVLTDAGSLAEADERLAALGVRTELAYERDAASGDS